MIETECLSDLRLDELLVGEPVSAAARAHLEACAQCQARRAALAADRARYLAAPPPLPVVARALGEPRRRRAPLLAGGLAAMAAAGALLFLASPSRHDAGDATRTKGGGPRLGVIVEHRGAQRLAVPGEAVHPGDTLVFTISTPRPTFVAVLGRDARGRVSTYFPAGLAAPEPAAAPLGAGAQQALPLATVLDDSLGAEQLLAIFCDQPQPVAKLRGALAAPPPGCTIDVFAIEKLP